MARVRDDEDGSRRAEVPLLASESSDRCLDVVDTCLRFDDAIEATPVDHAVGAALVSEDRDRHLTAPAQ
jgi:hypothetical protein